MTEAKPDAKPHTSEAKIAKQIIFLLSAQTAILILGSVNRLSHAFLGPVASNEFLRWVDFNNLLILPPLGVLAAIGIRQILIRLEGEKRWWIDLLFVLSAYYLGVGYGVHETTNYLSTLVRGRNEIDPVFSEIIRFNDDDFSHWVFFAAFFGQCLATLSWQATNRFQHRPTLPILIGCLLNAMVLAVAIWANLSRGKIGFDLAIVCLLALIASVLWWRDRRQLLHIYLATGFSAGLLATLITRLA